MASQTPGTYHLVRIHSNITLAIRAALASAVAEELVPRSVAVIVRLPNPRDSSAQLDRRDDGGL